MAGKRFPEGGPADVAPAVQSLKAAILERPVPIPGRNLCGRIQVGEAQEAGPRDDVQTRTWWVQSLVQQSNGWLVATAWDGKLRSFSPSAVAWVES